MCACPLGWKKTIALMTLKIKKERLTNEVRTCSMGCKKIKSYVLYKTKYGGIKFVKDDANNGKHISLLKPSLGVSTYMS